MKDIKQTNKHKWSYQYGNAGSYLTPCLQLAAHNMKWFLCGMVRLLIWNICFIGFFFGFFFCFVCFWFFLLSITNVTFAMYVMLNIIKMITLYRPVSSCLCTKISTNNSFKNPYWHKHPCKFVWRKVIRIILTATE